MSSLYKKALLRTLGFILWTTLSAWVFFLVEHTERDDAEEKYRLLRSLYESMASKYNMSIEEFNNFSAVAYEALSVPKPQWTFAASHDFVFQAVTTIGYGYITPQTPEGQILCIFMSLLGIPITMLAFKSVGELIVKWVNAIVTKFEKKILKRPEPIHVETKSAVILFSLMLMLLVIFGLIVTIQTDLTLIESVYFWFVTYTTIGFGDYVPGKVHRIHQLSNDSSSVHTKKSGEEKTAELFLTIFYTFFCVLGLCLVSSVLNSILEVFEQRKYRPRCPGCVPRKTQIHADNEQSDTPEQPRTDMTYLGMENFGLEKENIAELSVTEIK